MSLYYAQIMHADKLKGLYDKDIKHMHQVIIEWYSNKAKTQSTVPLQCEY